MDLFDFDWYRSLVKDLLKRGQLRQHYRERGQSKGLSPSPYFDPQWYSRVTNNPIDGKIDLLDHFVENGLSNLYDPHPLFNSKWYSWNYLGENATVIPLIHYIEEGWQAGNNPHPLFWGQWYKNKYLNEIEGIDPFYHFLVEGHAKGCQPNSLFDVHWYVQEYNLSDKDNALIDYIYGGHTTRDPHPLFDSNFYRSQVDCSDLSPLEHYLTNGSNANPCIIFDEEFFVQQARSKLISNEVKKYPSLVQFIEVGKEFSIDPHPLFSEKFYYKQYQDIKQNGIGALSHYVRWGAREGRQPHPLFEPDYFWEQFPETRNANPLIEYLKRSADSKARPRRPRQPDTRLKILPSSRKVVSFHSKGPRPEVPTIDARVGVFAHIFYSDLANYVVKYTNNIAFNCTIYISTTTVVDAKVIDRVFSKKSKHNFVIRVVPNRGRDIAPMIVSFRDAFEECDYAVHIHTKKSPHYLGGFDRWRDYLYKMNLGSPELVNSIVATLSRPEVGAVAPDHFAPIKPLIQWGGNLDNVAKLLSMCGETVRDESVLDLPSGSMFWFKPRALKKLLDLNLRHYHFDPEEGQVDGTLAHAIERGFFYFTEAAGYEWVIHGEAGSGTVVDAAGAEAIGNRYFPTDRDLGAVRKYYGECTHYLIRPSDVEKPRLNLMIPLIEQSKGYAGIATGIQIFHELRQRLGADFDARIITTDVSFGNQFIPAEGFEIVSALDADVEGRDVVIDGARRYQYPIFMRRNDIMLATAWWTAAGTLNIMEQQKKLFPTCPRKFLYLIQDFECGFYPWSTKYALADQTYRHADMTVPIFNTDILKDYFVKNDIYDGGHVLKPGVNSNIDQHIERGLPKEKIVLLYARPHAERNCLPFLDMLIDAVTTSDPEFWQDWSFVAIGEDFDPDVLRCTDRITTKGRLTLAEYGNLASRAALAISLMVSPHPSYPPMELANAGVLVLTNDYDNKDMSRIHDNIESFGVFDLSAVSRRVSDLGRRWLADPECGWRGKPKVDWFFDGRSNIDEMISALADETRALIGHNAS